MKELMKRKSINRIRVCEICEEAEIDRSTFYYHFKDKYALVAWIFYRSDRISQRRLINLTTAI